LACRSNSAGFSARGVGKVEPGSEKILGVGLDFEHILAVAYAPHIQDLASGWKSFGAGWESFGTHG